MGWLDLFYDFWDWTGSAPTETALTPDLILAARDRAFILPVGPRRYRVEARTRQYVMTGEP